MKKVKECIDNGDGCYMQIYEEDESVNILGVKYTISVKNYADDPWFKQHDANGYCSCTQREIVLCNMATYPGWNEESQQACDCQMKRTLRHEIVHAFLAESGLHANSNATEAWAENEEMVDWIAIQGPKIYQAWQEAGAI